MGGVTRFALASPGPDHGNAPSSALTVTPEFGPPRSRLIQAPSLDPANIRPAQPGREKQCPYPSRSSCPVMADLTVPATSGMRRLKLRDYVRARPHCIQDATAKIGAPSIESTAIRSEVSLPRRCRGRRDSPRRLPARQRPHRSLPASARTSRRPARAGRRRAVQSRQWRRRQPSILPHAMNKKVDNVE